VDDEVLPADNEFEWKFFPPLWSRPLLADVITSPLEGDAAPSLAHAYTCDMFGEGDGCQVPEGSARLAYGGVLLQRVARSDNATSVQRAAEWAVARGAEVVAGNLRLQDEERVDNRVTVEVEEWTVQVQAGVPCRCVWLWCLVSCCERSARLLVGACGRCGGHAMTGSVVHGAGVHKGRGAADGVWGRG